MVKAGAVDGGHAFMWLSAALVTASFSWSNVVAQTPRGLPPAARPAAPIDLPASREIPPQPVFEAEQPFPPSRAPTGAELMSFFLEDVIFDGATQYSETTLAELEQGLVGRTVTVADVFSLAERLQQRYRDDGFYLTRVVIEPQRIERRGPATISVFEGFVAAVDYDIDPALGAVEDKLRAYFDQLLADPRPHRYARLERQLLLANDLPGVIVSGTLRPARSSEESPAPIGAAALLVTARREAFGEGLVLLDNYGSTFTGETELTASVSSFSRTRLGERLTLSGLVSSEVDEFAERQRVIQASAVAYPGTRGFDVNAFFSYGTSIPAGDLQQFGFDSTRLLVRFGGGYWFRRGQNFSVRGTVALDYVDDDTDIDEDTPFTRDKVRVLELGGRFSARDRFQGINDVVLRLRQGLPILGASREGDPSNSNLQGTGLATTVGVSAVRVQPLPRGFSLLGRLGAQYAFDSVLASEEFDVGGLRFGRGFNPKEIAGDHGVGVTAEFRYDREFDTRFLEGVQPYAFYDFGQVWLRGDGFDDDRASTGLGLRIFGPEWLSADLTIARPLTPSDRSGGDKDVEALFRVFARVSF